MLWLEEEEILGWLKTEISQSFLWESKHIAGVIIKFTMYWLM